MGSGSMQVSSYKTKRGYYLTKDYDANYGGDFHFFIRPLIGFDNEVFFYVRELPDGKYEVTGEAYVITKPERIKTYKTEAIEVQKGKKLYYYHVDKNFNVLRKELDKKMKFDLLTMKKTERKMIFRLEDCDPCKAHLIGYVRGDFGRKGNEFWSTWFPEDESKNTAQFKQVICDVINYFRENTECPALRDYRSMQNICWDHPEWKLQSYCDGDNYAARVDTENYTFYIRFIIRQNDYNFYVFSYESEVNNLIEENTTDEEERTESNEQN